MKNAVLFFSSLLLGTSLFSSGQNKVPTLNLSFDLGYGCNEINDFNGVLAAGATSCD